uniref:Uncharacterized protein n=1 Tax=Plectus sambesii TaxID=2011161 RepID=A0A914VGW2_9BILA
MRHKSDKSRKKLSCKRDARQNEPHPQSVLTAHPLVRPPADCWCSSTDMAAVSNTLFFSFFLVIVFARQSAASANTIQISPRISVNCSDLACDFNLEIEEQAVQFVDPTVLKDDVKYLMDALANVANLTATANQTSYDFFNLSNSTYNQGMASVTAVQLNATNVGNEVDAYASMVSGWKTDASRYLCEAQCFANGVDSSDYCATACATL